MKCIHCSTDSKYKERAGRKCPKCDHRFAMEPKDGDKLTDGAIKHVLDIAGSNGQVKFLAEHAYLAYCRRHPGWNLNLKPPTAVGSWLVAAILGVVTATFVKGEFTWLVTAIPGFFTLYYFKAGFDTYSASRRAGGATADLAKPSLAQRSLTLGLFRAYLNRYCEIHGRPKNLIRFDQDEDGVKPTKPAKQGLFKEVSHYSFDRAVLCDRADLVDVLIANDFHFENNCAILSFDGHPAPVFDTVRKMLRKNPKLVVLVVHDASLDGCRLAWTLRHHPDWFAKTARIVDVGLRPAHAAHFANQAAELLHPGEVTAGDGIDPAEARWLSRYRLSAAAILPEQLVKRLHAAFAQIEAGAAATTANSTASDGIAVDLGSDTGGGLEAADSFG